MPNGHSIPTPASSIASAAPAAATPVERVSPVAVGDLILTRVGRKGSPAYSLPGVVTRINMEQQTFEAATLIDDGDDQFQKGWYPFERNEDWAPLEQVDERDRLGFIVDHLKDHTKRLNPNPTPGKRFNRLEQGAAGYPMLP